MITESAPRMAATAQPDERPLPCLTAGKSGVAGSRLALTIVAGVAGYLVARLAGMTDLRHSSFYLYSATSLLAIGLYGSTYSISVTDVRRGFRTVIAAVTVGVLAKSVLISGVMFLLFRQPVFLVLGVAVAQIDPLSVAVMNRRSSMSAQAKSILAAWASFDDPVTVLITTYMMIFAFQALGGRASVAYRLPVHEGVLGSLAGLGVNLGFAMLVCGTWMLVHAALRRRLSTDPVRAALRAADSSQGPLTREQWRRVVAVGIFAGLVMLAVWQFWMLGLALIGLVVRPRVLGAWLERAVRVAFVLAAIVLGMSLAHGIDVIGGVLLGAAAFAAQALVSLPLTRRLPHRDRIQLALAQQNGVTAIILALLLQPLFPQATAIVGPAVLTINALYLITNALWDRQSASALARGSDRRLALVRPAGG